MGGESRGIQHWWGGAVPGPQGAKTMRFTWQSLNERPGGTIWREGRAWVWGKGSVGGPRLHFEWSHLVRPCLACTLAVNHGERGWLFRLSFLLGTWYVGVGEY